MTRNIANPRRRQPLVAVSSDVRVFENYTWHAAPLPYLHAALSGAGVLPLIVPSFGDAIDLESLLDSVDGVMITGSKANVHPSLYGVAPSPPYEPYDRERDATTLPLIRAAIERGVPLLAICRGLQELNVALGGSLATEIQEDEGRMDHRAPESKQQDVRFAIRQSVSVHPGTALAGILGGDAEIQVNSLHRQAIDRVAEPLKVEATAADGTVEAVTVRGAAGFALGVQWHPEYWVGSDPVSGRIFAAFGDAVRRHAAARLHPIAAE